MTTPEISVVVPVLNEQSNVRPLWQRLAGALTSMGKRFEVIFVDDGSQDQTFTVVKALHAEDQRVRGLSFSRNFGHQIALLAGLREARGDVVVTLDGDLQHPPEVIPQLYARYEEGYEIVNTRRMDEPGASTFKKITSRGFYRLINQLSDVRIEPASADFRLMSRAAVRAFLEMPERDRFTRGLVSWMGFRQAIVEYQAEPRAAGETKYSLQKMMHFALNGITSFSSKPLRISFYMGCLISLTGLLYAVYAVAEFFVGNTFPGWTSILVSLLIIGGVILINLGIVGEYIARIFNEVKGRPLYFIREETGLAQKHPESDRHEQSEAKLS